MSDDQGQHAPVENPGPEDEEVVSYDYTDVPRQVPPTDDSQQEYGGERYKPVQEPPLAYREAELPPEYAQQLSVAEQLAQQQAALARPGTNLDAQGAPHFLRNIDGKEVCGQDGHSWPCPEWRRIETGAIVAQGLDPAAQVLPTMAEAALAAGMDLGEFEERLRQTRRS